MIMLLEPVTGICLDVAFLHVGLTWNIIVGGLIIIAANAVLITGQIRKRKRPYRSKALSSFQSSFS